MAGSSKMPWTARKYYEWLGLCIGIAGVVSLAQWLNLGRSAASYTAARECAGAAVGRQDSSSCKLVVDGVLEAIECKGKWSCEVSVRVPVGGEPKRRFMYVKKKSAEILQPGQRRRVEMFQSLPTRIEVAGEMELSYSHPVNAQRSLGGAALGCIGIGLIAAVSMMRRRRREHDAPHVA